MQEYIGWIATAIFSTSYFFRQASVLRWIQAAAALLWITYGISVGARPVVVANLIVAVAAVCSSVLTKRRSNREATANATGLPHPTQYPASR